MTPPTTPSVVEAAIRHEFAWLWSPWQVALLAVAAAVLSAVHWHFARGPRGLRLAGLAARLVAIAVFVVMLSGWRLAPADGGIRQPTTSSPELAVWAPQFARLGDTVGIEVELSLPAGDERQLAMAGQPQAAATAQLVDASGATVASAPLTTTSDAPRPLQDGQRLRARIAWRPKAAGTFEGDVRIRGDDRLAPRRMSVRIVEAALRVFLLDCPRFESRFLARHLSRTPRTEPTVRLRMPGATGHFEPPLPTTREAWAAFDVVVIGAFDPQAADDSALAHLVEAVVNDGVGIVWSLDATSDTEAIAVSPLGRLLPIGGTASPGPFTAPHAVAIAPGGADASWLALGDMVSESREAWGSLPQLFCLLRPTEIRPTARVVATARTVNASGEASHESGPFILVDRAAHGRIVAFLAETWRMRQGARGPLVDRLLSQAISFAGEPHLFARLGAATSDPTSDGEPAAAFDRVEAHPRSKPLWNHPLLPAALVAACGLEWWIRTRTAEAR